ncbi:MAG: hypothetical protein ABI833_08515 [Acidobacteriota bacterium]
MRLPISRVHKGERGNEIVEFALVISFFAPILLGTFVVGMNIIKSIAVNHMVRDMASMYIHGADFSQSGYQQLALRLGAGVNLKAPVFPNGANSVQSNTGSAGDGLIWITKVMYVGATSDPNCVSVSGGNCANHDKFVYLQRIVFGNGTLTSQRQSTLGDASQATIGSSGLVQNYLTDTGAQLSGAAQTQMLNLWQTNLNGQAPLTDGDVIYVAEGYFQSPSLSISSVSGQGVYARYFF